MQLARTAAALHQLRRLVLAIVLLGMLGLGVELALMEHYESWQQTIPLAALGAGVVIGAVLALRPTRLLLRAFQSLMGAFVAAGLAGLYLHYAGNLEFELERDASLQGAALVWEALRGATPALAPGAMIQLGLLGLVYAFRHPVLARGGADQPREESP